MDKDKWVFYKDEKQEWRWRRHAPNNKEVGASTEGYGNKRDCVTNAERAGYISQAPIIPPPVQQEIIDEPIDNLEIKIPTE